MHAARLRALVEELCSDACAGREPGTPGAAEARRVVTGALRAAGLEPELRPIPGSPGVNVLARAGGPGPTVLVGAHLDHLGARGGRTYRGADDNAAAVAVLLELAREPPALGNLLLAFFDCEEPPRFLTPEMGSMAFAREAPLGEISLAIILDLVGHAVGPPGAPRAVRDSLFVLGAEASEGTAARVDAAADEAIVVRQAGIDVIPPLSDYEPFRRARVPFVFLTCGRWRHYHTPDDTPDRLDYDKLAGVGRFTGRLARAALAAPRPAFLPDARAHATTVTTLAELARVLAPPVAASLDAIRARLGPDGRCSLSDWSRVLQVVATLEQGLA
jgi:hypothetical protein